MSLPPKKKLSSFFYFISFIGFNYLLLVSYRLFLVCVVRSALSFATIRASSIKINDEQLRTKPLFSLDLLDS